MRFLNIKFSNLYLALVLLAALCLYLAFNKIDKLKFSFFEPSSRHAIFSKIDRNNVLKENESTYIYPIAGYTKRITLKPFGVFVDPNTSPIRPERFTGFHTGVDVEYDDSINLVPVFAIGDGIVFQLPPRPGIGGSLYLQIDVESKNYYAIYSHLKLNSLTDDGKTVKKGDIIGYLGQSGTSDSAGERRHLHFSICKSREITANEYVANQNELENWLDPEKFYDSIISKN